MRKVLLVVIVAMMACGCAKMRNKWKSEGGFWASSVGGTTHDYVVISQSGGLIMDVWKLENVIVQSEPNSDGWLFIDGGGNSVFIGGDVKIIRCIETDVFDKYHEYHMEFEQQTYRDKFKKECEQ